MDKLRQGLLTANIPNMASFVREHQLLKEVYEAARHVARHADLVEVAESCDGALFDQGVFQRLVSAVAAVDDLSSQAVFPCPQCGDTFEDSPKECIVGGHWTPHSENDKPPEGFVRCCHQHQRRVMNTTPISRDL